MIIQRLSELWRRTDKHSENFNKELETIKKKEVRNTKNEIKNSLETFNSELDSTELVIAKTEQQRQFHQNTKQEKIKKKKKDSFTPQGQHQAY